MGDHMNTTTQAAAVTPNAPSLYSTAPSRGVSTPVIRGTYQQHSVQAIPESQTLQTMGVGSQAMISSASKPVAQYSVERHETGAGPSGLRMEARARGTRLPKRPKTKFTDLHIEILERSFDICRYPSKEDKEQLSRKLGLNEKVIKTWFQNRRMKLKAIGEEEAMLAMPSQTSLQPRIISSSQQGGVPSVTSHSYVGAPPSAEQVVPQPSARQVAPQSSAGPQLPIGHFVPQPPIGHFVPQPSAGQIAHYSVMGQVVHQAPTGQFAQSPFMGQVVPQSPFMGQVVPQPPLVGHIVQPPLMGQVVPQPPTGQYVQPPFMGQVVPQLPTGQAVPAYQNPPFFPWGANVSRGQ
ncbi:hypothetical protein E1189_08460 [Sansalvadorimonas verongulae]|nr:hypothetical protein [Sansalvadorimonas verongulae]